MMFTIKGTFRMKHNLKHCNYCESDTNDYVRLNFETYPYSGIEICMDRQGTLRIRVYPDMDELFTHQEIVNIKYCPVCGRKFPMIEM